MSSKGALATGLALRCVSASRAAVKAVLCSAPTSAGLRSARAERLHNVSVAAGEAACKPHSRGGRVGTTQQITRCLLIS